MPSLASLVQCDYLINVENTIQYKFNIKFEDALKFNTVGNVIDIIMKAMS